MNFFLALSIIFLFNSCSHKNAFSDFEMDKKQELSVSSLKRSKILKGEKIIGTFNAIYLNEIYPNKYNECEYFYIYIYLKEKQILSNPNIINNNHLTVLLNNNLPIKLKELKPKNKFSFLSNVTNKWSKYYLVSFAKEGKELMLNLGSSQSFSAELRYQKDQE